MRGPGILWMLQTAAGFSMAGPMLVVGFDFFRNGQPVLGIGFFTLGLIALYFPTYLINRIGGPRTWIRRRLGRRGSDTDDSASADADTDAALEGESERSTTVFDRFRR